MPSRRFAGDEADGVLIQEQPGFGHPDRNDRNSGPAEASGLAGLRYLGDAFAWLLLFGIAVDKHHLEVPIEGEQSCQPSIDGAPRRRIETSEIRYHDVDSYAGTSCQRGGMGRKRLVRRAVSEHDGADAGHPTSEICDPAGVVR